MNNSEYNKGFIDGVRTLYGEIVKLQKFIGLEEMVNIITTPYEIVQDTEEILSSVPDLEKILLPTLEPPRDILPLPNEGWMFKSFDSITESPNNAYNMTFSVEIASDTPTRDELIDLLTHLLKEKELILSIKKEIYVLDTKFFVGKLISQNEMISESVEAQLNRKRITIFLNLSKENALKKLKIQ